MRSLAVLLTSLSLVACGSSGDSSSATGGSGAPDDGGSGNADAGTAGSGVDGGTHTGPTSGAVDDSGSGDESGPVIPADHPRIYLDADNLARLRASLDAGDPAAARFRQMVDRQLADGDVYAFSYADAALLGVLLDDASYCSYAVEQIDAWVAAEEALIASGQAAEVAGDSYLYVGDYVGDLALVLDWCWDGVEADRRARWLAYADQAVWNVWHPEQAVWNGNVLPWSGWSIDNPSNNYYYSFLRATVLLGLAGLGDLDSAQTWIDTFRTTKIADQLVPTFTADLQGGGSREGTGYGVAMWKLFQLYDVWEASTGERIWDLTPHTRDSLANFLHYTMPTADRIAPIGDHARDSTASLFDYHRAYALVLQRLLGPDDRLGDVTQSFLAGCSVPEMGQMFMYSIDFLYADPARTSAPLSDLHDTWYAPGTGSVFFRSEWSDDATWAGFIAGPYTESHAHHDQGSLLVYRREWLGYDANIDSHSGLVQGEAAHNLLRLDAGGTTLGMQYDQSSELVALRDTPEILYLAADITPMYGGAGEVDRDEREVVFLEAEATHVVADRFDGSATAVWQLNAPVAPTQVGSRWRIDGAVDGLDIVPVLPAGMDGNVVDWTAVDEDLLGGFRLDLDAGAGDARFVVVLAPLGGVASVDPIDEAGTFGVDLAFASGATASVRFDRDAIGGELDYTGAGGDSLFSGALAPGLDPLPMFAD